MKRRNFITLLGGVAAWPVGARAQHAATPVVGFVYTGNTPNEAASYVAAFHDGLRELSFVEGQNIAFEYRWPGVQYNQLPALMAELVRHPVALIVGNTPPAIAAKTATSTIPVVFFTGTDPVKLGLVASFNRPGGNVTGVSFLGSELEAKRLGLLRELLPQANVIAALVDAKFIAGFIPAAEQLRDLRVAAKALSQEIRVIEASTDSELDNGFANLAQRRPDVLIVAAAPFFTGRRNRIVELAARQSLPAMYDVREFPVAGGLISYGPNIADAIRRAGIYAGRILKGEKPADLPVLRPTKFELVINAKTAKALGLDIPDKLLALADEVIE
jgi:putative ABC transport system substrate-binding protein